MQIHNVNGRVRTYVKKITSVELCCKCHQDIHKCGHLISPDGDAYDYLHSSKHLRRIGSRAQRT